MDNPSSLGIAETAELLEKALKRLDPQRDCIMIAAIKVALATRDPAERLRLQREALMELGREPA